ncbi:MAG: CO dehydrogenase/CO-methylating acetyl-CoA synthase complex subunit beta [Desulfarculaceae bacterium]|nr:CO dehydrogenase/CO-methylating acetyl-CoA synthase complex subunit beta [Desulfarculaceae bacterium]MCF8047311.1 CO dehydrogenase/CO-methylating acetyl-CoA synthase complex subunit beta [Desulfarculaceae bacterium]MCF8066926.1 CO dehydrogenase/CO-methylating acetyl-CoA synthase complex subunit beta [Desulfarculaceae bacterium]MCF8099949.1 CO dehydrogenase/CO-methylating acetyl-CoA synthase complex subunit beta [Desulfarculaceae bacterium]MCF8122292.1 CO dehydrogenase/CO-methylating acetyl-C
MSKLVAFAAIQGAYNIVTKVEGLYKRAVEQYGPEQKLEFPNTGYFLPIIYSLLGIPVKDLASAKRPLEVARSLLPAHVQRATHLPYLGPLLDAGMAALFAEEIAEAIRYVDDPDFYLHSEECEVVKDAEGKVDWAKSKIWLGAADDVVMRKRGVEFVDGSAPGFAAIVGAAPTPELAKEIAEEYQRRNLYVFMAANQSGTTFTEQLVESDVQVGWGTRLVPFGPDISAAVFALGFANRAAMAFGGVKPGDYRRILQYNKDRVFAFVNALGEVNAEWAANAAGCVNWGFPTIADTDIPEILPTGVCTYEHVVANVGPHEMVQKSVEVRGLKTVITKVEIPLSYGAAFEGERIRKDDLFVEFGGGKTQMTELVEMSEMDEIEDGKITVIGKDITDLGDDGGRLPMGISVKVAGRKMQADFEPILERQIHHLINYAQGVMHIGQRDIAWVRLGRPAVEKGFTIKDFGQILHDMFHKDFGSILDKVEVVIYTDPKDVDEFTKKARAAYKTRDERVENMTDEGVETYYSCTLCQSFAPTHVCVVSPERTGLCGAYNWFDCKASFEINPTGPNQPIEKGECLDSVMGNWKGVNDFVSKASRGAVEGYNFYSLINEPMTTCGCCECIAAVLPGCNGVMTVHRDYTGETPCGMKFTTLAGVMGGGQSSPGFVGHSKYNIIQRKFIVGDGGLLRMVWMPKSLKEELEEGLKRRGEEMGVPDLIDKIADETVGIDEASVLEYLQKVGHPAMEMDPITG